MQELLPAFETFIVEAAKECAKVKVVARSDWLASNEPELLLQRHLCNKVQETFDHIGSSKEKNNITTKRKMLCNIVR